LLTSLSTRLLFRHLIAFVFIVLPLFSIAQENVQDSLVESPEVNNKKKDFVLDDRIIRNAKDSVKVDYASRKAYLYGDASVEYGNITLKAAYIEIDFTNNTVFAKGMPDSAGNIIGNPIFKDGADEYETTEIRYNFTTRKGLVSNVTRQEGDAYVFLEDGKKMPDNVTYVENGHFTTCSLPHPHYRIRYGKGKIIPEDKIVTGPIYMEIEDIPLPLILPFGFFPNKRGRANGILIPSYGYTENRGYFLANGGYYTGLGEHMDLALRGDIYTRGSWAVRANSNYNFRYKSSGNLSLEYALNRLGETDVDDYTEDQSFFIRWSHRQDPKANPNSNFSANVNFGSTQFNKLNSYNTNDYLSNTFQSSIAYSAKIGNNNLSINLNHNQNSSTNVMNLDLPTLSFSTPRISPFKRKEVVGGAKWYEKINLTYRLDAKNQLTTTDTMLLKTQFEDFNNGIVHKLPLTLTVPVGYLNWTNSANLTEYWYFNSVQKYYDPNLIVNETDTGGVVIDRVSGFQAGHDVSFSSNVSTRIYGMYGIKYGPMTAVRHMLIPTLGFTYRPNVSRQFNYYREFTDEDGNTFRYSIFEGGIFNGPGDGRSGAITLNLNNTLEAKIRSKKDTVTGLKKIRLIEAFNLNTRYDLAKDSFQLSPMSITARTTIFKQIGVQFRGSWDFYAFDTIQGRRIPEFNWNVNKRIFRKESWNLNFSVNYNLNANTFKKDKQNKPAAKRYDSQLGTPEQLNQINTFPERYVDFNIPWSFNINYSFVYTDAFNTSDYSYVKTTVQTLNFSGDINITQKWKIAFRSGYDFVNKDISYTSLDIYRDLHCWEMMFNWIPIGPRRSYNLTIRVKSPLLQDLKINKRRDWRDLI
jgi:hypothetical protein